MSAVKYLLLNGNTVIGHYWEVEERKLVFIPEQYAPINFNEDLVVKRNVDGTIVNYIDLREFILDLIEENED